MAVPSRWPSQRRSGHDTHDRGADPDLTRPGSAPVCDLPRAAKTPAAPARLTRHRVNHTE
jgi:hypothetical protein